MNSLRLIRAELHSTAIEGPENQYELVLLNLGGRPAELLLEARDDSGQLSFSLPKSISVADGSEVRLPFTARAPERDLFGRRRSLPFTVSVQRADDPAFEPVLAGGRFEEGPREWKAPASIAGLRQFAVPTGIVAAFLLFGLAAAVVFKGSGEKKGSGAAAPAQPAYAFTAQWGSSANHRVVPASLCYHLNPENVPFHVVLSQWDGARPQALLDEWDDDGVNGGDCVMMLQVQAVSSSMVVLQAFVGGSRVGQVVLSALRY